MADVNCLEDASGTDVVARLFSQTRREVKSTKGSSELFLKSLSVWINKPHVVNRRLCGTRLVGVIRSDCKSDIDKVLRTFFDAPSDWKQTLNCDLDVTFNDLSQEESLYVLLIRELVPKSDFFPNILEAVFYGTFVYIDCL